MSRSHERESALAGTSLAAETDGAQVEKKPAESRLQPRLAAPQSRPINNRPQVANPAPQKHEGF